MTKRFPYKKLSAQDPLHEQGQTIIFLDEHAYLFRFYCHLTLNV